MTDLPGSAPDADDSSGALCALKKLSAIVPIKQEKVNLSIQWLLDVQNNNGGFPTFCRGWGKLHFDKNCHDITAHAIRAFVSWENEIPEKLKKRVEFSLLKSIKYLKSVQLNDGSWLPLWFGNEHETSHLNQVYANAALHECLNNYFCSLNFLL